MTADNENEALERQVDRALRSSATEETPAELDAQVLNYALEHAPTKPKPGYIRWMSATAAACLCGVAILIALPLSPTVVQEQPEFTSADEESTVFTPRRPSPFAQNASPRDSQPLLPPDQTIARKQSKLSPPRGEAAAYDSMADADSAVEAEFGRAQNSAADVAAAAPAVARTPSPPPQMREAKPVTDTRSRLATTDDRKLAAKPLQIKSPPLKIEAGLFAQLKRLTHPEDIFDNSSEVLDLQEVQEGTDSEAEDSLSGSVSAGHNFSAKASSTPETPEIQYQKLREACACELPENLPEAKEMLNGGKIVSLPAEE